MYKVLLLICAVSVQQKDCQEETALAVLEGPEANNVLICGLHSQAYLASSALAASLSENEYLKIACRRVKEAVGPRPADQLVDQFRAKVRE